MDWEDVYVLGDRNFSKGKSGNHNSPYNNRIFGRGKLTSLTCVVHWAIKINNSLILCMGLARIEFHLK